MRMRESTVHVWQYKFERRLEKAQGQMSAVKSLNPKAEVARAAQALAINTSGARGLQDVLRTNLGPKGTLKM